MAQDDRAIALGQATFRPEPGRATAAEQAEGRPGDLLLPVGIEQVVDQLEGRRLEAKPQDGRAVARFPPGGLIRLNRGLGGHALTDFSDLFLQESGVSGGTIEGGFNVVLAGALLLGEVAAGQENSQQKTHVKGVQFRRMRFG